jgi:hypothetical protein
MLDHYDAHEFVGNPNVLRMLPKREPISFSDGAGRDLANTVPA